MNDPVSFGDAARTTSDGSIAELAILDVWREDNTEAMVSLSSSPAPGNE